MMLTLARDKLAILSCNEIASEAWIEEMGNRTAEVIPLRGPSERRENRLCFTI